MPADFRAKIEGSQPVSTGISSLTKIEEDILEDIEGEDGVDVTLSYQVHRFCVEKAHRF